MNQLKKKLKDLQRQGFETVSITQIQQWIYGIEMDRRAKSIELAQKHKP